MTSTLTLMLDLCSTLPCTYLYRNLIACRAAAGPPEFVPPPYTDPPERRYPLGPLLAAAGCAQEAAEQLSEEQAALEVQDVFKDSRKVWCSPVPSSAGWASKRCGLAGCRLVCDNPLFEHEGPGY